MTETSTANLSAIVLAAGASRRMGGQNKHHLDIDGTALLRRCVNAVIAAKFVETIVVLGYEWQRTEALVRDLPVRTVVNHAHAKGKMTSVHCGLSSLTEEVEGTLICLGDQPALTPEDIGFVKRAFHSRHRGIEVVVPEFEGLRGNPIAISANCRAAVVAGERNLGCRNFVNNNKSLVQTVSVQIPAFVCDLDTVSDYTAYVRNTSLASAGDFRNQWI